MIRRKKMFKNKCQMIVYTALFIIIIAAFIYIGSRNYNIDPSDNIRFADEFNDFTDENIFKYEKPNDILNSLDNDIIILFGSNQNEWTKGLAELINEVAIDNNIEEIIYYDFFDDRLNNNGNYELIVEKLSNELYKSDLGVFDINAPLLLVIKNGEILYNYDELSHLKGNIDPTSYWSINMVEEFKITFDYVLKDYLGELNG